MQNMPMGKRSFHTQLPRWQTTHGSTTRVITEVSPSFVAKKIQFHFMLSRWEFDQNIPICIDMVNHVTTIRVGQVGHGD